MVSKLILPGLFFCIIFYYPLHAISSSESSSTTSVRIKFSGFRDKSGYDGPWDLGGGIGDMFRKSLSEISKYQVVASSLPSPLGGEGKGEGDILLAVGTIEKFEIQSEGISSQGVGGYERFRSTVELKLKIQDSTGSVVLGTIRGSGKIVKSNLGLSLLGGPVGYEYTKKDLNRLWTIRFDSDELRNSIVGESIQQAIDDLIVQISLGVMNTPLGLKGSIVKIRGVRVYINIGTENKVSPGQVFFVYSRREKIIDPQTKRVLGYTKPKLVGKIKIVEVTDKHLSVAEIIEGKDNIKKKDMIILK